MRNYPPTPQLQLWDASHHLHPFTHNRQLAEKGVRVIKSAKGIWLEDTQGQSILDAMAGLWCVNVGYGREELVEAAARQMRELPYYNTFFQSTSVPAIELSKKLSELAPGSLNHVFYGSSGSDGNDTVIKLVRTYWEKKGKASKQIIVARKNGYHGSTIAAASLGGMAKMHSAGIPIPGIVHINQPFVYEAEPEDEAAFAIERARELEAVILEHGADNVAAFIGEPIQGAGGVIIPPDGYWEEIQRICDKYEVLLVADEVICGYGRTGNWFGSQSFGIDPDIMTTAKGLTSGYIPLSAVIVSDEISDIISQSEFAHGFTYSGHPVACAVALENLRILEDEMIVEQVHGSRAPHFCSEWDALASHPLVGEAVGYGLLGAVQITPDKKTRASFEPLGMGGAVVRDCAMERGVVMRAVGDRMVVCPPLVITKEEISLMVALVRQSLDDAFVKLYEDGVVTC